MSNTAWLLVVWAVAYMAVMQEAAAQCQSMQASGMELPESSQLQCGHVCRAEQGWKMLPVLWAPLNVELNCSTSSYTVLTGNSKEQLLSEDARPVKWCGLAQVLSDPRVCRFKLSPLQDHYLAVSPAESNGLLSLGSGTFTCVVNSTRELSIPHMMLSGVGALLFFNAAQMTMSQTFRLTSGSLMFMSGAVVVLAFVLMRSMPYKRSLVAFFTVSTSSMLAMVRWLYGTWLPDAHSLLLSRPFLIYLAVTGLLGLAVTYWMDDPGNVKLNTTIRVTLQLTGLLLVYMGISDERVALAAVLLLVFSRVLLAIGRRLAMVVWWVLSSSVRLTWRILCTVAGTLPGRRQAAPEGSTATSHVQLSGTRMEVAEGSRARLAAVAESPLPDDEAQAPLLSDEEEEYAAAQRRRHARREQRQPSGPAEQQGLGRFPSFQAWMRGGTKPHAEASVSPIHLKQPPPASPFVQAKAPTREQQQQQQQQQPAAYRAEAFDVEPTGYRFPSSTPSRATAAAAASTGAATTTSPWSRERVAFDITKRVESPSQVTSPAAPAAASPGAAAGGGGSVSPLVAMGKILNPETGKTILINKATYNHLISQGYQPDWMNGILIPPAGAPAEAWAGVTGGGLAAGRGVAAVAGSSGGGVSPAANTRQRRPRSAGVALR